MCCLDCWMCCLLIAVSVAHCWMHEFLKFSLNVLIADSVACWIFLLNNSLNENRGNLPIAALYIPKHIYFLIPPYKEHTYIWFWVAVHYTKWAEWSILAVVRLRTHADVCNILRLINDSCGILHSIIDSCDILRSIFDYRDIFLFKNVH